MYAEDKILIGCNENMDVFALPRMANRHGVIAGATGTGKTVTLKVLAESFSICRSGGTGRRTGLKILRDLYSRTGSIPVCGM